MKKTADSLISDLASTIAFYEKSKMDDAELEELCNVAEAAMNMLVILRRHQLERRDDEQSLVG